MPRVVVFDTNILLSGVGWRGNPYRCLELSRSGVVEGVTCRELLEELVEKLQVKLDFSPAQATDTVVDLLSFLRLVTITNASSSFALTLKMTRSWSVRWKVAPRTLSRVISTTCSRWEAFGVSPLSVLPSSSSWCLPPLSDPLEIPVGQQA